MEAYGSMGRITSNRRALRATPGRGIWSRLRRKRSHAPLPADSTAQFSRYDSVLGTQSDLRAQKVTM